MGNFGKPHKGVGDPIVNDNVIIYANVVVIGSVKIDHGVVIGAGSVVLNDVPSNTVAAGIPAVLFVT